MDNITMEDGWEVIDHADAEEGVPMDEDGCVVSAAEEENKNVDGSSRNEGFSDTTAASHLDDEMGLGENIFGIAIDESHLPTIDIIAGEMSKVDSQPWYELLAASPVLDVFRRHRSSFDLSQRPGSSKGE